MFSNGFSINVSEIDFFRDSLLPLRCTSTIVSFPRFLENFDVVSSSSERMYIVFPQFPAIVFAFSPYNLVICEYACIYKSKEIFLPKHTVIMVSIDSIAGMFPNSSATIFTTFLHLPLFSLVALLANTKYSCRIKTVPRKYADLS